MIHEICIYLGVLFEPNTFVGIIFHFFEMLLWLKLVNYTKLDVEPEN